MAVKHIIGVCLVLCAISVHSIPRRQCSAHVDCDNNEQCLFTFDGADRQHGLCFSKMDARTADEVVGTLRQQTHLQLSGPDDAVTGLPGLNVTSLTVNAPEGQSARVVLGSGETQYSFGVHADGTFAITQGTDKDVLAVNKDGDVVARTKMLYAGALSADQGFIIDTVHQWAMWKAEDFSTDAKGWSKQDVTRCAGIHMLGGTTATAKSLLSKKYTGVPQHHRIRIVGTFHFVDLWQGETGFMQVNNGDGGALEYVWTERYDLKDTGNLINVCGKEKFGEGKFAVPFDVTIYHTSDELEVVFGTTLASDAGEATWGVSNLQVYIRSL